jgi:hypothetical protein
MVDENITYPTFQNKKIILKIKTMRKIIALLSILIVSILSGITFGHILDINPVIPGITSFVGSVASMYIPLQAGCLYELYFTTPAAAGTYPFNVNYMPEFIIYDAAAAPLTNLRVSEQNAGVLVDLPLAAIAQVRTLGRFGLTASTVTRIRLANGHIKDKNVTITLTQPGAVAIPVHLSSDCPGNACFKYTIAALLAGQPLAFTDFTALFLPGLAAGDFVRVEFTNGHIQTFAAVELLEFTSMYQSQQLATGFILNNINCYIHRATVTEAIAGVAYVMQINPADLA